MWNGYLLDKYDSGKFFELLCYESPPIDGAFNHANNINCSWGISYYKSSYESLKNVSKLDNTKEYILEL
jgi:hypothetical protein